MERSDLFVERSDPGTLRIIILVTFFVLRLVLMAYFRLPFWSLAGKMSSKIGNMTLFHIGSEANVYSGD